jgi:hypothetical protein
MRWTICRLPVEVARKTAKRQMKAIESKNDNAGKYEEKAKKNKRAAKIMHTAESG